MADPAAFLPDKEEQANSQKLLVQISMKIKKTKRIISKMYIGPYVAEKIWMSKESQAL